MVTGGGVARVGVSTALGPGAGGRGPKRSPRGAGTNDGARGGTAGSDDGVGRRLKSALPVLLVDAKPAPMGAGRTTSVLTRVPTATVGRIDDAGLQGLTSGAPR